MYRKIVVGLVLVVSLSCTTLAAAATKAKKHTLKVDTTVLAHNVGTASNGAGIVAGATSDPRLGPGGAVYFVTSSGATATSTFTAWTAKGSVRGKSTVTQTGNPDGSATLTGGGTVTGGTGLFKGIKGALTITGRIDPKTQVLTFTVTGTLKY